MISKTVRAESMIGALDVIKKELGPDALVVSVRKVMGGPAWMVWRKPLVEVVAVKANQEGKTEKQSSQPEKPVNLDDTLPVKIEAEKNIKSLLQRTYQMDPLKPAEGLDNAKNVEMDSGAALPARDIKSNPVSDFNRLLLSLEAIKSEKNKNEALEKKSERDESRELIFDKNNGPISFPPVLNGIYEHLLGQGLDRSLLDRLCSTCSDTLSERSIHDIDRVIDCIRKQLSAGIKFQKESVETIPHVIYLVGTSGVGKTSICAKLAVHFKNELGINVGWVCADTVRVSALDEARTFTEAIGIPMNVAYTPDEMENAVYNFQNKMDCVLVDTPAFNPRKENSMVELGNLLTVFPHRNTWLVTSATAKDTDLQNTIAALGPFKPRGIIITKLDETNNFGSVYNLAWKTQLRLVYFSFGNRVLSNIIPARADLLIDALLEERFNC